MELEVIQKRHEVETFYWLFEAQIFCSSRLCILCNSNLFLLQITEARISCLGNVPIQNAKNILCGFQFGKTHFLNLL